VLYLVVSCFRLFFWVTGGFYQVSGHISGKTVDFSKKCIESSAEGRCNFFQSNLKRKALTMDVKVMFCEAPVSPH
jgi:hypothetical protein